MMRQCLQAFLKTKKADMMLLTRTDSFLGEYYPPEAGRLATLSGFKGSAGLAIILPDRLILFVDARYTIEAKTETTAEVFEVPTETTPFLWLSEHAVGKKVLYQPWTHTPAEIDRLQETGAILIPISDSETIELFGKSSFNQEKDVFLYPEKYAGASASDKCMTVAAYIRQKGIDAFVMTNPENTSWLLNRRSRRVPAYPVVYERGVLFSDGRYQSLESASDLSGLTLGIDFSMTPIALIEDLRHRATLKNIPDIISALKSIKNKTEIAAIQEACLFESLVVCRFLEWVETHKSTATEQEAAAYLIRLRSENPLYLGDSFETIAAVGKHAALAHYHTDVAANTYLSQAPLFLVDTGGQYLNGTTDMTRTIAVGEPTCLMRRRYTQVLKGHIALASACVRVGEKPARLDTRAHAFLRADGVDYLHATGHGIGMCLAVHEMPPIIHEKSQTPLLAGMVFSNEPAVYDEINGFGIRLENMLLTVPASKGWLKFQNLLLIPFDARLVDSTLLTRDEKRWLCSYHQRIMQDIWPSLSAWEQRCLKVHLDFFLSLL